MEKISLSALCAVLALGLASCTTIESGEAKSKIRSCKYAYEKDYLTKPLHKAIATTGRRSPLGGSAMSCGTGWGYSTKEQAIKRALHECRLANAKFHEKGECAIYAAK